MSKADTIDIGSVCLIDEDTHLVQAAQATPLDFKPLYQKWLKPVYRYFYFRVGNEKEAEDLTSQVFLKVYEDLPRYQNRGYFSAWLFSIARPGQSTSTVKMVVKLPLLLPSFPQMDWIFWNKLRTMKSCAR